MCVGSNINQNQDEIQPVYGGDCPWVGVKYQLNIELNTSSPLQLMNKVSRALFLPKVLVLDSNGGFRRPEDLEPGAKPLFPMGGMDLKWRWDADQGRIVIDFIGTSDNKVMPWRWDECTPTKDLKWPYFLPDFECIGHVGSSTFEYKLTAIVDTVPPYISQDIGSTWQLEVLESDDEVSIDDDCPTCTSASSGTYLRYRSKRASLMQSLKQSLKQSLSGVVQDQQDDYDPYDPCGDYLGCPKMIRSSRYLGWVQIS